MTMLENCINAYWKQLVPLSLLRIQYVNFRNNKFGFHVVDKSNWDTSALRTNPFRTTLIGRHPRCGQILIGPIPKGCIRFADLSTLWMYPAGTNPFRTNPKGMHPLCGLIHFVDVSRRDLSFQDLSSLWMYPEGIIPFRTNATGEMLRKRKDTLSIIY